MQTFDGELKFRCEFTNDSHLSYAIMILMPTPILHGMKSSSTSSTTPTSPNFNNDTFLQPRLQTISELSFPSLRNFYFYQIPY
jgi:hypothetical protein